VRPFPSTLRRELTSLLEVEANRLEVKFEANRQEDAIFVLGRASPKNWTVIPKVEPATSMFEHSFGSRLLSHSDILQCSSWKSHPNLTINMSLSTEEYNNLSTEEREAYDAKERQREREEQASQSKRLTITLHTDANISIES
jgi:hypothetical protein